MKKDDALKTEYTDKGYVKRGNLTSFRPIRVLIDGQESSKATSALLHFLRTGEDVLAKPAPPMDKATIAALTRANQAQGKFMSHADKAYHQLHRARWWAHLARCRKLSDDRLESLAREAETLSREWLALAAQIRARKTGKRLVAK